MHLMEVVATQEQKERWLRPLASGATRSCFCMTEPAPGAGSDPCRDADHGAEGRQSLRHQRREVVHHRRGRRGLRDHHGEGRGWSRDHVPVRHGSTRHRNRPRHGQSRQRLRRWSRGGSVQQPARSRLRYSGRAGQRVPLRTGPAGAGAVDPLHALARHRPPRARHRDRLRAPPRGVRRETGQPRRRRLHARGQRDRHPHEPAGDLAHRVAAGSGRARHDGIIDGQGVLLGSDLARGRSLRSGARRPGRHRRNAGGADLQRGARLPHL